MNIIDMAKLVWTEKAAVSQKFPQFVFTRSKIDRVNKPIGKQLEETAVPIIPQLRQILDVYASPYNPGEFVFPDIFLNAVTDEQKAIRVHDFNRRISKNIKDVCVGRSASNVLHHNMPAIPSFLLCRIMVL